MIRLDPTPCLRYPWSSTPCPSVYSGAHACRHAAGHAGLCCCAQCGWVGIRSRRCDGMVAECEGTPPIERCPDVPSVVWPGPDWEWRQNYRDNLTNTCEAAPAAGERG